MTQVNDCNMLIKCRVGIMSEGYKVWMCKICQSAMCHVPVPKFSIFNKMGFVQEPPELNLYPIEEGLVAQRIQI